jgi:hypothetical protein
VAAVVAQLSRASDLAQLESGTSDELPDMVNIQKAIENGPLKWEFYSDLMGFYSDSMGYSWDTLW